MWGSPPTLFFGQKKDVMKAMGVFGSEMRGM
jgi:hypothetical protein